MAREAEGDRKIQIGHVLVMEIVDYSRLHRKNRTRRIADLTQIVGATDCVRQADAQGKLLRAPTPNGMELVFFSDLEAPIKCAMEISSALASHRKIRLRMGIHSGPVNQRVDSNAPSHAGGEGIDMARRVMRCGDPGHILLSRRLAYDLVSLAPQWNAHLYELDQCDVEDGQPISLVNLYTNEIGNPQLPAKMTRAREKAARKTKEVIGLPGWLARAIMIIFLSAIVARIFVFERRGGGAGSASPLSSAPVKSIAVLPFTDLSIGRDQGYFCDGLTEEIRNALAEVKGLLVIGRTSSTSFRGDNIDPNEVARRLNVTHLLEGRVLREGTGVRVAVELINRHSYSPIWSETLEAQLQEGTAISYEITRAIVTALGIDATATPQAHPLRNVAAYDLYLQGLFFSDKSSEENLRTSLDFFRRALEKDPNFSPAWTGIAKDWLALASSFVNPRDAYPQAQIAVRKALVTDARDAEAHAYLGETRRVLSYDLETSEVELKRAVEINPNSVVAHLFMAYLRRAQGNSDAELTEIREAVRLDPLSPVIANSEVNAFVANDRLEEAFASIKRSLEIDPNYAFFEPELALVYREQGNLNQALDIYLRLENTRGQPLAGLAITYARLGKKEEAGHVLDQLLKITNSQYFPADQIASVYVALDKKDEAFRWLERAIQEHSPQIHEIALAREFRALHSDPRFAELLRRIGLDPAKFLDKQRLTNN